MANLTHSSFKQPQNPYTLLWRYMDLSKFVALIQKSSLVFPRADKLGDPFEGSAPLPNIQAFRYVMDLRKSHPDQDPYKGLSDEQVSSIFSGASSFRRQALLLNYMSCWHMNDSESAAMWKIYSKSSVAVCITTDYHTLSSILPDEVCMGEVEYVDYNSTYVDPINSFSFFMMKRKSFSHEKEARAIFADFEYWNDSNSPYIKEFSVPLNHLIKKIYVSPESPDWFRDVVSDLVIKYGLDIPVQHSELNSVPLY